MVETSNWKLEPARLKLKMKSQKLWKLSQDAGKPARSKEGPFRRFRAFAMNRMAPSIDLGENTLAYWRVRILFAIIFTGVLLGTLVFVPLIALVIKKGMWGLLVFDGTAWVIGVGLLFSRRPSYEIRAAISSLIIYAVGVVVIISVGFLSGGPVWLFAFAVFVAVFLGTKPAILALTVNAITLMIIGWLINSGVFGLNFPLFNTSEAMLVAGANFMLLNTISALSVAVLANGLIAAHQKEKELATGLEKERLNLVEAKKELETEIEERKLSQEALRKSEERYRALFECSPVDTVVVNERARISMSNMAEETGRKLPKIGDVMYKDYAAKHEINMFEELMKCIRSGNQKEFPELEYKERFLHIRISPFSDGAIITSIDVTEMKNLYDRLRQAQKMESIGTLAGGVAHEFNNILGAIIGNTQLALGDIAEWNPAKECLKEIQSASFRAKDVVSQILGFARKSVFELRPVKITPIIEESLMLIRASIPPTIVIHQEFSCKFDTVLADPAQISQILMNLCDNARNAMQGKGGVLEIRLENTSLDEKSATRYEDLHPGKYVKLTVRDTGHGIDPKITHRIFDPYFTTTNLAEGTGMGLAVVYGIVKHHNSGISVESEPGKGSVFEVLFPLMEAEAKKKAGKTETLPTGAGRILFIDDEESLVNLGQKMLSKLGYNVETKKDPIEALALIRSEPDRFDLVITDLTMPQMTGDKMAQAILEIRPDIPIILCTGFSEKGDEKARALGIRKCIEKPFELMNFAAAIREVLN